MTRYKTASAKAMEAPATSTEGAVQQLGRIAHEEAQASGSNAALRLNGERLQEEHAVGWKKSCGVAASTTPSVVTGAATATSKPFANSTKVLLASKRSGGSVTTECVSSPSDRAPQKRCRGASKGDNGSTASCTSVSNILNESLENETQNKHSLAFSTTAEQTVPVTRGRSAAVKIDSKASRTGVVSPSAARVPVANRSSTQTRARSLNAQLRARPPVSSPTAVVDDTEVGRRPKHSPSVPDRIIIRSCQRGITSEKATSTNGESAGVIIDETRCLASAAPPAAVASTVATSKQTDVSTRAASSTRAHITRVILANGGDAASDPNVANERGRRAGGSERDDSRSRGRSASRGNRGTSGGRKGGKGRRRGGGRGGGGGGKEGGEDDEQDEDEDGDDGTEIGEDAPGGGEEIESLENVRSRLHQVGTAILLIGDPEKVTTVTDESVVEATASAPAANVPPGRDSECRRRRMPTARLQQHLVEVQRNSRARSAKKGDSKSQGGTQQHQHQAGAKAVATVGDSNACGSRGGAVEANSSTPATVAGRGSRVGGGRISSRKRRRSVSAVTNASSPGDVGAPVVDVGGTHSSVGEIAAAREAEVMISGESAVAKSMVATPVIPPTRAPSFDEGRMRVPAGKATVVAPPSITDVATAEVRVAEARAEGLRAADAKIAEAKAAAAKARADEATAAVAANEAFMVETQSEAVAPPEATIRAEAGVAADEVIPPPLDTKVIDDADSNALTSSTSCATAPCSSSPVSSAVTTFWDAGAGRKQEQQKKQQKRREVVATPANGTTRTHHTRSCGGSVRARVESSERNAREEEAAAAAAAKAAETAAKERAQRREDARVAAEARAAALEEMKWEECVDESEAFVTAMLASVVRSLAEGPKTEMELDQSVRSDMDAGRAAAGLPVADWSESHMVNVRLVVDVLIALGLVRSEYNTAEQASGWPMDVHPPSEDHGGAPAPCFCSSVMRRAVARHTKMSASSLPDAHIPLQPFFPGDPFQLGIPWNPAAAPDGGGTGGGEASFQPPVVNAAVYGVPGQVLATAPGAMTAAMSSDMPAEGGVAWVYAGLGTGALVGTGQGLQAKGEIGVDGMAAGVIGNAANAEVQSIPTVTQVVTGEVEPGTVAVSQAAFQSAHRLGEVDSVPSSASMAPLQKQEQCPPESTFSQLPGFRSDSAEASGDSPGETTAVGDACGDTGAASQVPSVVSAEHSETAAGELASSYGGSGVAPSTSTVDTTAAALSTDAPPSSSSPDDPSSSPLSGTLSAKTAVMPVSSISNDQKVLLQSAMFDARNDGFLETSTQGTVSQWGENSALAPRLGITNNSATSVATETGGNDGTGEMNASLSYRAPVCPVEETGVTANALGASIADGQASMHQASAGSSISGLAIPDTPPPKRVGVAEALMLTRMGFEGVFSPTEERRKLAIYNSDGGGNSGASFGTAASVAGAVDDDGGSSSEAINVAAMELEALDSPPPSGSCKSITTAVGADVALTWGGGSGGEGIGGTDSDCRDAKASLYARFLRDPAGVVVPTPHNPASATATPVTAAVVAAMAASAQGDVTDVSPENPLEVVALGEELSEEAKALAEEGLFDLVGEAWGDQTTELAHAYMEYALPHLPIDAHAFELAVEGKLQPGGELEAIYGKPAVEVLNLWLYLKSETWVKWRDAQVRTGSNVGANGGGGGNINTTSVPSSYFLNSGDGSGNGLCGVSKGFNAGGVFSAGSARKGPGGRNSGRRSATGKSSGRARGREGRGGTASGSTRSAAGGVASSRGNRQRHVRYRLERDQDRYLVDWEEPARRALKLEMEAARLALCEEAVLRDLLRRCGISLPPGYARASAIDKLRGRSSSIRRNSNGQTVGVRAQVRGGAAAASVAVTADMRQVQYNAQTSVPEWSTSSAGGAVVGSGGKLSRGGSLEGVPDKAGRPRAKGKAGKGGLRRQSSVGRPRTKSSKRRKVDGSLEDFAASDNDRGSLSDSSLSSYRHYRSRSSPGGWDHYGFGEDGISTDATVPPSLRGFTPGLTAAEAITLARQHASANATASSSSSLQQQQPRTSALNTDGGFHTTDGGVRKDTGGGNSGGGGITRENSSNSRFNGGRRRSDWTMLTPHVRCPLPLLRGTRGHWRSSTGGVGSVGGVGGWNGHGGGNGGLDSSGSGGSGNGGGGSSMKEGESFILGSSSSTSSARRRKGGSGSCGGGGSYDDGDVGFGEGKNNEAGSGDVSIKERAVSPAELFMGAMPKAIPWADVARQFAPINDAGGTHPPPSPIGSKDITRASSFPGASSSLSSSTNTAAAAGHASKTSAVADTSGLVGSNPICNTIGLTVTALATSEVATSSATSGSSTSANQLRISVPPNNIGVSMRSDAGGDVGSGGGREIKLEKMSSQASGGAVEIIAPTYWLVGTSDEGTGSTVEMGDGNGETSGEDTSDEAFDRRHTEHLAWMKDKIEAARRARELASPRPPPKKRAGSFSGGRGTPKSGNLSGAAAAATGGGGGGGAASVASGVTWGQAGGSVKGSMSRKNSGGRKSRSSSDANSQRSRNRRGASGSPRASFTTQQTQLSEAQVDAASSTPATLLPDAAAVAEPTEPTASISTAVETMNPSDHVGVLASVVEDNCASIRGVASTATSVAPDCDHGRGLAEGAGGEALAPSISSDAGELGVACEKDKVTSPLDVSTRGSCGGTDGLTAVAPPVVTAGQADPSAAGVSSAPDLLQPTPSRLPSLSPPSK